MKLITLTKGQFAMVDDDDYERLIQHRWQFGKHGYAAGYINRNYRGRGSDVLMHRWIMGAGKSDQVDHISGDKLDNRKANLRIATHQQNSFNRGKTCQNKSGFKGVAKHGDKWRCQIGINYKQVFLGVYDDPKDAHSAYCEAAKKYHGEFAKV